MNQIAYAINIHPRVSHNTQAAIDFLRKWAKDGPWVLTAIIPDGKTFTQTFYPKDEQRMREWIEGHQGKENLYFHVNPTIKAVTMKATKSEIARMAWLHVDIDPRVGEDIDEERERALKLLKEFKPAPTVIVDSGGGYQGFWRLQEDDRLVINGRLEAAETLEAFNVQLARVFGADHCHNIDRIMRLPGSINIPTKRKVAKGRKPVLASLVEFNDNEYPITVFTPAVQVQAQDASHGTGFSGGRPKVKISGNIPDMGIEELKEWLQKNKKTLSEHCMAVIASGEDPFDSRKYASRSDAVFYVVCEMVRQEIDDDVIYAVINGNNAISAHIKDQANPHNYTLRQIRRAKEKAIAPELLELNDRHAVITSGKVRILSWKPTAIGQEREALEFQTFEDFRNRYRHRKIIVATDAAGHPTEKRLGDWWLDDERRREYKGVTFLPGKDEEINGMFNLWRGWGVKPRSGSDWSLIRDHILFLFGGSDYGLKWLAHAVQYPDRPAGIALVLRGKEGTGKGFFGRTAVELFGQHGMQITNTKHLTGNFNAHLRDCCLLFADEVVTKDDPTATAVMKTLITENKLVIEGKGVNAEVTDNFVHIIMASNDQWVVPAGASARRFAVFDVPDTHIGDYEYFSKLEKLLYTQNAEGLKAPSDALASMLYDLLHWDLEGWEPYQNIPETKALTDQKRLGLKGFESYIFDILYTGNLPEKAQEDFWIKTEDLMEAARLSLQGKKGDNYFNESTIRSFLVKKLNVIKKKRGNRHGYFLDIAQMRLAWDQCSDLFPYHDWPDDWHDDEPDTPAPF